MKIYIFVIWVILSGTYAFSQNPVQLNESKKYTMYAGINYLNNYVYNGRADSLKMNYVIPSFTYINEKGLTLNSEMYILCNGANNGFDFMELNGEYAFDIYKNFSGAVTGTKFFSNGNSESFIGNLNYIVGGYLNQKVGIFDLVCEVDILHGASKSDIRLSPGIESTFEWNLKKNHFELTPSFYAIFSTLNYFENYSNTKKLNAGKRRVATANTTYTSNNTLVDNPGLTFMTFEVSMPFTYENDKMGITFIPTLALPKNPITTKEVSSVIVNNKIVSSTSVVDTPYSELNLRNIFFGQLNFYVKF